MEIKNNTFIPHESKRRTSTTFGSVMFVLSIGVFVVVLGVAGFTYFLRTSLDSQIGSYQDSLNKAKERFNQGLSVRTIEEFDKRLRASRDILSKHKSFTGLLNLVERITLQNVQFTSFSYMEADSTRKNIVRLVGRAPDYKTIAEQSEQFSLDEEARRYISDVVFSNLNLDTKDTGLITFEISMTVDPEFLLYSRYVNPVNTGSNMDEVITGVDTSSRNTNPNIRNQ